MPKIIKHKLTAYATPGNSFSKNGAIYSTGFLMLVGEEKNKKAFIKELKKDSRVIKVEVNHDLVMFVEKRSEREYAVFRSTEIMTSKPIYCNPADGFEYWNICAWNKKQIQQFLEDVGKIGTVKLLSIQKMKLNDLYHFRISPRLTSKQKQALEMALQFGYFKMPREVELDELGKRMKISHQAFSEHLRKAESKLLPHLAEDLEK